VRKKTNPQEWGMKEAIEGEIPRDLVVPRGTSFTPNRTEQGKKARAGQVDAIPETTTSHRSAGHCKKKDHNLGKDIREALRRTSVVRGSIGLGRGHGQRRIILLKKYRPWKTRRLLNATKKGCGHSHSNQESCVRQENPNYPGVSERKGGG